MHREPQTAWSSAAAEAVGVLGATSFVGRFVLTRLHECPPHDSGSPAQERQTPTVFAFSRAAVASVSTGIPAGTRWVQLPVTADSRQASLPTPSIPQWIAVCPLWAVAEQLPLLEASGARRLVALSSTSRFTKRTSVAPAEQSLAARLAAAEDALLERSQTIGIATTILRPTLIYDGIHDRNVARIAAFIRRFGFYPVAGAATGLRQPIHADDVAAACLAALARDGLHEAYDISGGETLPYRDMVQRIFAWLGRPPRLAKIPLPLIRVALSLVRPLPGLASMATIAARMNEDLVFDHGAATRDFGFHPRSFTLPKRRDSNHAGFIDR